MPRYSPALIGLSHPVAVFPLLGIVVALVVALCVYPGPGGCTGRPVLLPAVASAPCVPDMGRNLELTLQADGALFLETKWYPPSQLTLLTTRVRAACRLNPLTTVVLKADRSIAFASVRQVFQCLQKADVRHVLLRVEVVNQQGLVPNA